MIEIADTEEHIARFLPILDGIVGDGMVTVEKVQVVAYWPREDTR